MPNRSEYQPLAQGVDDEETDVDIGEGLPSPVTTPRGLRRLNRPGHIDLTKLDTAFKRQAITPHHRYFMLDLTRDIDGQRVSLRR